MVDRRGVSILCLLSVVLVAPLAAQKNCKKGIPCGNSCISADKVCRIGAPTATPRPVATPESPTSPARSLVAPATADSGNPAATTAEYPWVASFADGVYFRADCPAAQDLAPANRRFFRTHQDAEAVGFRRSRTPDC
jgi:Metal binding domain of Ada